MEVRFSIDAEDYDEVIDRMSDLNLHYEVLSSVPAKNMFVIRIMISTYKEYCVVSYIIMLFAMLRDE